MGTEVRQTGFTVIEVMLFLVVSATLAAAIFGTSMLNINQQRYADAVRSFKALVQEQYVNTTRVQNPNSVSSQCPDDPTKPRGTGDCLVIGKLLSVTNGDSILIRNIVGTPPDPEKYNQTGVATIGEMTNLTVINAGSETLLPAWSTGLKAKLASNVTNQSKTFSLAIVRSPVTGTPYTFFMAGDGSDFIPQEPDSIGEDISSLLSNQLTESLWVCIDPTGLTSAGKQMVILNSKISGPSGVSQGGYQCTDN